MAAQTPKTTYAKGTHVPAEQTESEIRALLKKHGAGGIVTGEQHGRVLIAFEMHQRHIRFVMTLPELADDQFRYVRTGSYTRRTKEQQHKAWEQACREKWRLLFLTLKAKLESVNASGLLVFEDEFLAYTVIPGGTTVAEWLQPQLTTALETGRMPPLLPG